MKEFVWNRTTKTFLIGLVLGFILGAMYGVFNGSGRIYND